MKYFAFICFLLIVSQISALRRRTAFKVKADTCSVKQAFQTFSFTNGWTSFDKFPRLLGDVNGDGLKDIVAFGDKGIQVAYSNGDGTFAAPFSALGDLGVSAGGWVTYDKYPRAICDVNGDGKDDVVGFGDQYVWVALSNGQGFNPVYSGTSSFSYKSGWGSANTNPRLCADVDGDGKVDIVGFANDGVYVAYGDGKNFGSPQKVLSDMGVSAGGWSSFDKFPRCIGKFNPACGAPAAIIGFGDAGVYVSTFQSRNQFSAVKLALKNFSPSAGGWESFQKYPRFCADMNGDGRVDIVGYGDQNVFVSYGNENGGFSEPKAVLQNFVLNNGGWSSFDKFPRSVGKILTGRSTASLVGFGNEYTFTAC